jgi:hypothetical protein
MAMPIEVDVARFAIITVIFIIFVTTLLAFFIVAVSFVVIVSTAILLAV